MKRLIYPSQAEISEALARPSAGIGDIDRSVREVISGVRAEGDVALREFSQRFDGCAPASFKVEESALQEAETVVPEEIRDAMRAALASITAFHSAQLPGPERVETAEGVKCWSRDVAIGKVGLYIPGGTAPLF
ncbi:MAG: histidinol dehydrogenase, partial [Bacteroidales bacterium]|nr:histidinol dehydrogenase [Bacteroidales bacterium]